MVSEVKCPGRMQGAGSDDLGQRSPAFAKLVWGQSRAAILSCPAQLRSTPTTRTSQIPSMRARPRTASSTTA